MILFLASFAGCDENTEVIFKYLNVDKVSMASSAPSGKSRSVRSFRESARMNTCTSSVKEFSPEGHAGMPALISVRDEMDFVELVNGTNGLSFSRRWPCLLIIPANLSAEDLLPKATLISMDRQVFFYEEARQTLSEAYWINGVGVLTLLGKVATDANQRKTFEVRRIEFAFCHLII